MTLASSWQRLVQLGRAASTDMSTREPNSLLDLIGTKTMSSREAPSTLPRARTPPPPAALAAEAHALP